LLLRLRLAKVMPVTPASTSTQPILSHRYIDGFMKTWGLQNCFLVGFICLVS